MKTKSKSEGKRAAKGKLRKECINSHLPIFYVEWLKSLVGDPIQSLGEGSRHALQQEYMAGVPRVPQGFKHMGDGVV